jgi:hypothetical protein
MDFAAEEDLPLARSCLEARFRPVFILNLHPSKWPAAAWKVKFGLSSERSEGPLQFGGGGATGVRTVAGGAIAHLEIEALPQGAAWHGGVHSASEFC